MMKFYVEGGEKLTDEERKAVNENAKLQEEETVRLAKERAQKEIEDAQAVKFMNAPFEPHEDRVLVYPDAPPTVTESGIYVPDVVTDKMKPLKGVVVRVGPGKDSVSSSALIRAMGYQADNALAAIKEEHPKWYGYDFDDLISENKMKLVEGDRIIFGKYAGTEFEINGIKYLIMRFADIFGREKK